MQNFTLNIFVTVLFWPILAQDRDIGHFLAASQPRFCKSHYDRNRDDRGFLACISGTKDFGLKQHGYENIQREILHLLIPLRSNLVAASGRKSSLKVTLECSAFLSNRLTKMRWFEVFFTIFSWFLFSSSSEKNFHFVYFEKVCFVYVSRDQIFWGKYHEKWTFKISISSKHWCFLMIEL